MPVQYSMATAEETLKAMLLPFVTIVAVTSGGKVPSAKVPAPLMLPKEISG